jgi:hypothetical protein
MSMEAKRRTDRVTGVSNVTYDLLVILSNKLEGAAAIEQYKEDAQGDRQVLDLLNRLQQNSQHEIQELQSLLSQHLSSGQKARAA